MRWIVGLDFRSRSAGALRFARWLYQNTQHNRFYAVHALELPPYANLVPDELAGQALAQLNQTLEREQADSSFTDVGVVVDERADRGLAKAIEEHTGDGVIIGRRAPADSASLIALGRIARRVIREIAQPTIVVPPDQDLDRVAAGPILLATDLAETSLPALRFAGSLANELGRELIIVHTVRVHGSLEGVISGTVWSSAQLEHRQHAEAQLSAWAQKHGAGAAQLRVVEGPISPELLAVANEERASLIVCGSRRLSLAERIFSSSVGTELAAAAPIPVAIIPHDHVEAAAEGIPAFA